MKYKLTFKFYDAKKEAISFAKSVNENLTQYAKSKYPAKVLPWESSDKKEKCFIVWYHYK